MNGSFTYVNKCMSSCLLHSMIALHEFNCEITLFLLAVFFGNFRNNHVSFKNYFYNNLVSIDNLLGWNKIYDFGFMLILVCAKTGL